MKWFVILLVAAMTAASISHFFSGPAGVTFLGSGIALFCLSKFLGKSAEQLSRHLGQSTAGLLNITLSNLPELIIIFTALSSGLNDLVRAGIVGSITSNLLMVHGCAIYFGCRKNSTLNFNTDVATLYINQLFLVVTILMLLTLFKNHIDASQHQTVSVLLAAMLIGLYLYFFNLRRTDKRFKEVQQQAEKIDHHWSIKRSVLIMMVGAGCAFFMSELLVNEVETVSKTIHLSTSFLGFILLPLLGNLTEQFMAITAARDKDLTELSLAIAVGSASQVGMVVAPLTVFISLALGRPFLLDFSGKPLEMLIISSIGAYVVLKDDKWNINEGVMLIALYLSLGMMFFFCT
jgi:Ca2+:H+ antiporter